MDRKKLAACFAGFFGLFLTRWLTNSYVFPSYMAAFAGAAAAPHLIKDVAVGSSALVLAAVALVAFWKRDALGGTRLPLSSLALLVAGILLTVVGQSSGIAVALVLGAVLVDVGCGIVCVMICMGAMGLDARLVAGCVAAATAATYLARFALMGLDAQAGYLVFAVVAMGTAGLSLLASTHSPQLGGTEAAPAELAVTNPRSFLPLGHKLYVALLAFEVAYGFAITVGDYIESSSWSLAVGGLLLAVAALALAPRAAAKSDWLLMACILAVLGGILAFPVAGPTASALGKFSLSAGSNLFQVLAFFTLVTLGSRNRLGSLVVVAWGSAAMDLGVILGANAGRLVEGWFLDPATAAATAIAAFVYTAAMLAVEHNFSIQTTVSDLEGTPAPVAPVVEPTNEASCRRLASEHGLTAREEEVLLLLAKGRNSPFIQEELHISYNTARTHVRHIYEKCGFHNQQELIDAVETAVKDQPHGMQAKRGV